MRKLKGRRQMSSRRKPGRLKPTKRARMPSSPMKVGYRL